MAAVWKGTDGDDNDRRMKDHERTGPIPDKTSGGHGGGNGGVIGGHGGGQGGVLGGNKMANDPSGKWKGSSGKWMAEGDGDKWMDDKEHGIVFRGRLG